MVGRPSREGGRVCELGRGWDDQLRGLVRNGPRDSSPKLLSLLSSIGMEVMSGKWPQEQVCSLPPLKVLLFPWPDGHTFTGLAPLRTRGHGIFL